MKWMQVMRQTAEAPSEVTTRAKDVDSPSSYRMTSPQPQHKPDAADSPLWRTNWDAPVSGNVGKTRCLNVPAGARPLQHSQKTGGRVGLYIVCARRVVAV